MGSKILRDKQHSWRLTIDRMAFAKEFEWFSIFWAASNHHEGVVISLSFLRIDRNSLMSILTRRHLVDTEWSNKNFQIIIAELRHGIRAMKNGKSSVLGGIVPKLMKCGEEYLNKYQLQLINSCLEQNKIYKEIERILCNILCKHVNM